MTPEPSAPLARHAVDDATLPELRHGPFEKGLRVRLLRPDTEARPPDAPAGRWLLLAVFRLDAAATFGSHWALVWEGVDAGGRRQPISLPLTEPLPPGDNLVEPTRADGPPPKGLIYRGAFWADVDALVRSGRLAAGQGTELRYGDTVRQALAAAP